jgi:hypothetical protein
MQTVKERVVRVIEARARRRTGQLAGQLVRAAPVDREGILAELELERWLAEACQDALLGR